MLVQHNAAVDRVRQLDASAAARQEIAHWLQSLIVDESASLSMLRKLTSEISDPTAQVVLGLLVRDSEQDRALLQRVVVGALDVLTRSSQSRGDGRACTLDAPRVIGDIEALSRSKRERAQHLRDLACGERGLDHASLAMLLDAIAGNGDKHSRLLAALGRYLRFRTSSSAALNPRLNNP